MNDDRLFKTLVVALLLIIAALLYLILTTTRELEIKTIHTQTPTEIPTSQA